MCNYGRWVVRLRNLLSSSNLDEDTYVIDEIMWKYGDCSVMGYSIWYECPDVDTSILKLTFIQSGKSVVVEWTVYGNVNTPDYYARKGRNQYDSGVWLKGILRRWLRAAKLRRSKRVLRGFVNDYVIPHLYDPHREGPMFIKLKNKYAHV